MQRAFGTALLTAIRNLYLYYYKYTKNHAHGSIVGTNSYPPCQFQLTQPVWQLTHPWDSVSLGTRSIVSIRIRPHPTIEEDIQVKHKKTIKNPFLSSHITLIWTKTWSKMSFLRACTQLADPFFCCSGFFSSSSYSHLFFSAAWRAWAGKVL